LLSSERRQNKDEYNINKTSWQFIFLTLKTSQTAFDLITCEGICRMTRPKYLWTYQVKCTN